MKQSVKVIGLTGPTGAGKSTATAIFAQNGWHIIDADGVARGVVSGNEKCLQALAEEFGADVIENGILNRRRLAERAFATHEKEQRLNAITHPLILEEIKRQIAVAVQNGKQMIVIDAPLLFESGADILCDFILGIVAKDDIRLARIMERDGIDESAARLRMSAQPQEAFYREKCDMLMENNGTAEELSEMAWDFVRKIQF